VHSVIQVVQYGWNGVRIERLIEIAWYLSISFIERRVSLSQMPTKLHESVKAEVTHGEHNLEEERE
jgi:hypothetical protein